MRRVVSDQSRQAPASSRTFSLPPGERDGAAQRDQAVRRIVGLDNAAEAQAAPSSPFRLVARRRPERASRMPFALVLAHAGEHGGAERDRDEILGFVQAEIAEQRERRGLVHRFPQTRAPEVGERAAIAARIAAAISAIGL